MSSSQIAMVLPVDWSELLPDLLTRIANRVAAVPEDLLAFRRVCSSWRASAKKCVCKLPLLMLAEKHGRNARFYGLPKPESSSLSKRKICTRLPVLAPKGCKDVGFGWILTLGTKGRVCLVNPFSSASIELPTLTTLPGYGATLPGYGGGSRETRGVLTANPSETSNFMLYVAANQSLGVWKKGDEKWTKMDSYSQHIAYLKGKLYSLICAPELRIEIWDPQGTDLSEPQGIVRLSLHNAPEYLAYLPDHYLVESTDGELLLVTPNTSSIFGVMRVDLVKGECMVISDLGKDAIFVGDNAVSVDATEFPGILKPNCIYFTCDCSTSYFDNTREFPKAGGHMGIYNVKDGSVERFDVETFSRVSLPQWVFPSFCQSEH